MTLQVASERPPEGLARGKYAAAPWTIAAFAAVVALAGLGFLVFRFLRARRRKKR